jgi:hypothetical protein
MVCCSSNNKDYVSQFSSSVLPSVAPSSIDKYSSLDSNSAISRLFYSWLYSDEPHRKHIFSSSTIVAWARCIAVTLILLCAYKAVD